MLAYTPHKGELFQVFRVIHAAPSIVVRRCHGGSVAITRRASRHQPGERIMKKMSSADARRLQRDPRFVAAQSQLIELQVQRSTAEKERDDLQSGISSLASRAMDALNAEAQALLSGEQAPGSAINQRQKLTDSLGQVEHRIAVLRQAIFMQQQNVESLTFEVSRTICADLKPDHIANVRAMATHVIALGEVCKKEAALRDELNQNGVKFTSWLRPMPLREFDLTDSNSRGSRFLLECVAFGFLEASEIPASLRPFVAKRG
jgi:hypothetical protein